MIIPSRPITPAHVGDHYDALDVVYRAVWGEHVHHGYWVTGDETPEQAVRQLVDLVAKHAGVGAQDAVVDIGCGYGATARRLANNHGCKVIGFTVSARQHAGARLAPGVTLHLQDWTTNEQPTASADVAVSLECLAHVPDKQQFFAEVRRVLRPGGRLVLTAWLAGDGTGSVADRWLLEPICREGRLAGMGTAQEYAAIMRQAGLEDVTFTSLRDPVRPTWRYVTRRLVTRMFTRPALWAAVPRIPLRHWSFLLTLFRIRLAYRSAAMDYGMFTATRGV